jgi:hypothetical protein
MFKNAILTLIFPFHILSMAFFMEPLTTSPIFVEVRHSNYFQKLKKTERKKRKVKDLFTYGLCVNVCLQLPAACGLILMNADPKQI